MIETWRPVNGYEGYYEVSNTGKVRSVDRLITRTDGKVQPRKGKELFFSVSNIEREQRSPRAKVQLWKDGVHEMKSVHRLVADAFVPNPENLPEVNHIDGNPLNNYVDNLEWITHRDNVIHAYTNGLISRKTGRDHHNSKRVRAFDPITGDEIVCDSVRQLAKRLNVSERFVGRVARENDQLMFHKAKGYIVQYL